MPLLIATLWSLAAPGLTSAQGFLEQFSYEGLRLSGISLELGGVVSDRLESEVTGAIRLDLGYLAPRVRLVVGGAYFKSPFRAVQIARFEQRLIDIIDDPTADATVSVGQVTWANIHADADLQYMLLSSGPVRPYAGVGLSLIIRNGTGAAITGTFVEDALDTFTAGLSGSAGVEVLMTRWLSALADVRGSLTSELRSLAGRGGLKFTFPGGSR